MQEYLAKLTPIQRGMPIREALTVERIMAIQGAIFALTRGDNIQRGANVRLRRHAAGYAIIGADQSTGASPSLDPWQVTATTSDDSTTLSVFPGSINDLIPSNIFTPLTVDPDSPNYVKVQCTTNGQWPTAATLVAETTPPSMTGVPATGSAPMSFEVTLAIFNAGVVYQIENAPLTYIPQVVGTSTITPDPGGEPFVRLWAWTRLSP